MSNRGLLFEDFLPLLNRVANNTQFRGDVNPCFSISAVLIS